MRLGGIDDVVIVIEPMADQGLDQLRRMLAVAVDEQHGAEAGVVEPGKQRRFLTEIARQRHHLDVERIRRQAARDAKRVVGAAVVDIDDFAGERAARRELLRDLDQPRMQALERGGFVVERHHDRQARGGAGRRRAGAAAARAQDVFLLGPGAHLLNSSMAYL